MIRRVLVTGATGFFGRHFCRYLAAHAPEVELTTTDIVPAGAALPGRFVQVDLANEAAAAELIRAARPDCVVHLAGTFGTGAAVDLYQANLLPLVAVLEGLRQEAANAILITAGSAAEYGRGTVGHLPVDEDCPCAPVTLYGQSKLAATQVAQYYHRVHGLGTMVVRPFQLLGPGMSSRLAPGAFAEQLHAALASGPATVRVGNLESQRDFLDVRDAAEAVWALCSNPAPGEVFNLCAGRPTRMGDLLQIMMNVSQAKVVVETDPARLRGAADVSTVYGSFQKLNRHCGWQPRRSLEESARSMFAREPLHG